MALNERQRLFVREYLVDFNGTKAAIRAGYSEKSARQTAFDLLTNPAITEAIEDKQQERLDLADLNIDWILRQYKLIAAADPSELMWTVVRCCIGCYPGQNYDASRPPLAACPLCRGEGEKVVRIAETRKLTGAARRLYAGAKQTKDGIEIKMRDQDGALKFLAQYHGMCVERRELSTPGGKPFPVAHFTAKDLTDDQLAQLILQEEQKTIEGTIGGTSGGTLMLEASN